MDKAIREFILDTMQKGPMAPYDLYHAALDELGARDDYLIKATMRTMSDDQELLLNEDLKYELPKPRYIAHTGGDMPVSPDCVVEVVFKGGEVWEPTQARSWGNEGGAGACWWRHESSDRDNHIIAYRVIEQE
jgi:hypothetical protein